MKKILAAVFAVTLCFMANAQNYPAGLVDKTIAVVGGESIMISDVEAEVHKMQANGRSSDPNLRCWVLENLMEAKIFLMQARIDSLTINQDMVQAQLTSQIDYYRSVFGGDEPMAEYFGKPVHKIRQEWQRQFEEMSLTQQEQQQIASKIDEVTPYDVKMYLDTADVRTLPEVPMQYQMSQICIYPDREAAAMAAKEKLLGLRERIVNGAKFSTLARLYSNDPASAPRGGELGLLPKGSFWPAFTDAAMALKPGNISQIVETPDGFHILEVLEKKGDLINVRHILVQPEYTSEDQEKAFRKLDSLRTQIDSAKITFDMAARFFSEDPATRTNGGQMADPQTGSAYFDVDHIKPADYAAVANLEVGEISKPVASLDNEGRNGNLVYKIIRLDKVIPAHTATLETDYTELLGLVKDEKQHAAIDAFLEEKLKSTYIIIDPIFKNCDFSRKGWASHLKD